MVNYSLTGLARTYKENRNIDKNLLNLRNAFEKIVNHE